MEQFDLDFEGPFEAQNPALWTPRDIWVRLSQRLLEYLKEDRRFERKSNKSKQLDQLAEYYSTFSNTPDGGLIIYGIEDDGEITGCNAFSPEALNEIESSHRQRCPLAKPEFKKVPVVINGKQDFVFAIYVPS